MACEPTGTGEPTRPLNQGCGGDGIPTATSEITAMPKRVLRPEARSKETTPFKKGPLFRPVLGSRCSAPGLAISPALTAIFGSGRATVASVWAAQGLVSLHGSTSAISNWGGVIPLEGITGQGCAFERHGPSNPLGDGVNSPANTFIRSPAAEGTRRYRVNPRASPVDT